MSFFGWFRKEEPAASFSAYHQREFQQIRYEHEREMIEMEHERRMSELELKMESHRIEAESDRAFYAQLQREEEIRRNNNYLRPFPGFNR